MVDDEEAQVGHNHRGNNHSEVGRLKKTRTVATITYVPVSLKEFTRCRKGRAIVETRLSVCLMGN